MTHTMRSALLTLSLWFAASSAHAGVWTPESPAPITDHEISGSASHGDSLALVGDFGYVGARHTGHIALWDGASWSAFGDVDALASIRLEQVFAPGGGGAWYVTGTDWRGHHIWRWTGTEWADIPGTFDGHITSVVWWRGQLVVVGRFSAVDSIATGPIARYSDAAWRDFGGHAVFERWSPEVAGAFRDTLHVSGQFRRDQQWIDYVAWGDTGWVVPPDVRGHSGTQLYPGFVQAGDRFLSATAWGGDFGEYRDGRWMNSQAPQGGGSFRAVVADGDHLALVDELSADVWEGATWMHVRMPPRTRFTAAHVLGSRIVLVDYYGVSSVSDERAVSLIDGSGPAPEGFALGAVGSELFIGYDARSEHRDARRAWRADDAAAIRCMRRLGGELWASGRFSTPDGDWVGLARYAGDPATPALDIRWRPWGRPLASPPWAFTFVDGAPVVAIAEWDSSRVLRGTPDGWQQMGDVLPLRALAVQSAGGALYVAGRQNASDPALRVWRQGAWMPVPDAPLGAIYALADFGGRLAVGGVFSFPGPWHRTQVAVFDGARWDSTLTLKGDPGNIRSLAVHRGELFAGGDLSAGTLGVTRAGVVRLHDGKWVASAGGMQHAVTALLADGDRLYAATQPSIRETAPTYGLFTWSDADGPAVPDAPAMHATLARARVGHATLRFTMPAFAHVRLRILDVRGREVAVPFDGVKTRGTQSVEWDLHDADGRPVAPGLYILESLVAGTTTRTRIVVVR